MTDTATLQQIRSPLDTIVDPESIALVGITVNNPDHWTRTFLDALLEFGFDKPLYLVNPKGGEIRGLKVYSDVGDIPGRIEYVISTVPARASSALVYACAKKGVKVIHFCTAGFSEIGTEEGRELERQLVEAGRQTGIRLLGPNCMGPYCPGSRIAFEPSMPHESGPVGYVSQSGGNVNVLVRQSVPRGVRFSKVFSYGNASDINECDLLEYLASDPETRIIAMYLEGVRDGPRFKRALSNAVRAKPVVVLKGGVTEGGARAVHGHTASLAGKTSTWEALCRQTGAINVANLDEMADVLVTLRFMQSPKGKRALLFGGGGGASVLMTDAFERNGLVVPPLPPEDVQKLREFSPDAGNILRNPLDYSQSFFDREMVLRAMKIASSPDSIDFVVAFMCAAAAPSRVGTWLADTTGAMLEAMKDCPKPSAAVIEPRVTPKEQESIFAMIQAFVSAKVPVYYSFDTAARAISLVLDNEENRRKRAG